MIPDILPSYDLVDWSNPVNFSDPRNSGLISWYLAVPNYSGFRSFVWRDLCRRNNGALTNITTSAWGFNPQRRFGAGFLSFSNSSRQYVDCGDVRPAELYVSVWFYLSSTGQNSKIISHWDGADGWILTYQTSSGKMQLFSTHGGASVTSVLSSVISTGQWYRADVVLGSGRRELWLNGVLSASDAPSGALDYGTASLFISSLYSSIDPNNSWRGHLDDVRVSSRLPQRASIVSSYRTNHLLLLNRIPLPLAMMQEGAVGSSWYYNLQQQLACDRREEILQ